MFVDISYILFLPFSLPSLSSLVLLSSTVVTWHHTSLYNKIVQNIFSFLIGTFNPIAKIFYITSQHFILLFLSILTETWKTDSLHAKTVATWILHYLCWWEIGERFHTLCKDKKAYYCLQTRVGIPKLPLKGW